MVKFCRPSSLHYMHIIREFNKKWTISCEVSSSKAKRQIKTFFSYKGTIVKILSCFLLFHFFTTGIKCEYDLNFMEIFYNQHCVIWPFFLAFSLVVSFSFILCGRVIYLKQNHVEENCSFSILFSLQSKMATQSYTIFTK